MTTTTRRGALAALGLGGLAALGSGSATADIAGGPAADAMSEHRVPYYRVDESDLDSPGVVGRRVEITSGGASYEAGDQLVDTGTSWELIDSNVRSLNTEKESVAQSSREGGFVRAIYHDESETETVVEYFNSKRGAVQDAHDAIPLNDGQGRAEGYIEVLNHPGGYHDPSDPILIGKRTKIIGANIGTRLSGIFDNDATLIFDKTTNEMDVDGDGDDLIIRDIWVDNRGGDAAIRVQNEANEVHIGPYVNIDRAGTYAIDLQSGQKNEIRGCELKDGPSAIVRFAGGDRGRMHETYLSDELDNSISTFLQVDDQKGLVLSDITVEFRSAAEEVIGYETGGNLTESVIDGLSTIPLESGAEITDGIQCKGDRNIWTGLYIDSATDQSLLVGSASTDNFLSGYFPDGVEFDGGNNTTGNWVVDTSFSDNVMGSNSDKAGNVYNGLGFSDVAAGSSPTASNWPRGINVENINDNTIWTKDSAGSMRQVV